MCDGGAAVRESRLATVVRPVVRGSLLSRSAWKPIRLEHLGLEVTGEGRKFGYLRGPIPRRDRHNGRSLDASASGTGAALG